MYKLKAHSLTRLEYIRPEKLAVNLEEKNSSATLTLGPEDPDIAAGDWIEDPDAAGGPIVWRVKSREWSPEKQTYTLQMEHLIRTLGDYIMFGEVSGEKTAAEMARELLGYQSDWKLGRFDYNSSSPWKFDSEKLIDALETVTGTLDGAWWAYDMSQYPFVLHIVNPDNYFTGFSEMRAGRNIQSLRHNIDRSQMYTRFYPIGKENLTLPEGYLARNEEIYGTVCKVETDQNRESEEELRAWAEERLRKHCEPAVTVTISGVDLSRETGEDIDRLAIGRACRVPLPAYGKTIQERVTKLQWKDRIKEPENITVTLSNGMENVRTIAEAINEQSATSSRGGRAGAKKAEEDHAWFVDTTDHVAMVAEAVAGPGAAENWSRVAEVVVDGQGIHQRVVKTVDDLVTQTARIDTNERGIAAEIEDRTREDGLLRANITATAEKLTSEYTAADGALRSLISQTADEFTIALADQDKNLTTYINAEAGKLTTKIENGDKELATKIEQVDNSVSMSVGRVKYKRTDTYASADAFPAVGEAGVLYYSTGSKLYYTWDPTHQCYYPATQQGDDINYIKAGEIAIAFNEQTGKTEAKLDADVILCGRGLTSLADLGLPDWMDAKDGIIAENVNAINTNTINLNAVKARVSTLETDYLKTANLYSAVSGLDTVFVRKLTVSAAGNIKFEGGDGATLTGASAADLIKNLKIELNSKTNTYTLSKATIGDPNWQAVGSFSRATTLEAGWSGGTYTVKATPQDKQVSTTLRALSGTGDVTRAGKWVSRNFIVQEGPDGDHLSSTGATLAASINASSVYNEGWKAAYSKLDLPHTQNTSSATMTVKYPSVTVDEAGTPIDYTVSADNSYAYIKRGSMIVAQVKNPAYEAGQKSDWLMAASAKGSNHQATLAYDTYYYISGVGADSTWKTPKNTGPSAYVRAISEESNGVSEMNLDKLNTLYKITTAYKDEAGTAHDAGTFMIRTPSASHSPTATIQTGWTGSISGRTNLGSATASSLKNTYLLIDAKCGGTTKQYYFTLN